MNVLFISKCGDSLSLAMKVRREGHNEMFYVVDSRAREVGKGLVTRVSGKVRVCNEKGEPLVRNIGMLLKRCNPDVVVFDMVGLGKVAEVVRKMRYPVFGGSLWADHLELDRWYGYKVMKLAGIKVPKSYHFTPEQRERAVKVVKSGGKWVYKPDGNAPTSYTLVQESDSGEEVVEMIERGCREGLSFVLQEKVEGVVVSCEMWWNGVESSLHNLTIEWKRLMNDEVGPNTGCSGNIVMSVSERSKLVREGVGRMERLLKKVSYRGCIDLNSVVNEKGVWGLEFTPRLGYDAIQTLLELYQGELTRLIYDVAVGNEVRGKLRGSLSMGVRVSIPPYPSEGKVESVVISGYGKENEKHVWLADVKKEEGKLMCSGYDGYVCCVTAEGRSVRECRRRVYRTISNLHIPNCQYRTDIGTTFTANLDKLKGLGVL